MTRGSAVAQWITLNSTCFQRPCFVDTARGVSDDKSLHVPSDDRNGCLGWLLLVAVIGVYVWLAGPPMNAGPLGDDRPCVPLVKYCYDVSRGRPTKNRNYATTEECERLLDRCRP